MTLPAALSAQLAWPSHFISMTLTGETRAAGAYLAYEAGFDSLMVRKRNPKPNRRTAVKRRAMLIAA